jgi:glycine cleavage system aminomethyltransferase T
VPTVDGQSVLVSLRAAGLHPSSGPLCASGDCSGCVATIDGTSYVRTCRTPASAGLTVVAHPTSAPPNLPRASEVSSRAPVQATTFRTEIVIIGRGRSGRAANEAAKAAGRNTMIFDDGDQQEVVAVHHGPTVVVRTPGGMWNVQCEEVIVASGSADILPVCEGSQLSGIVTRRAFDTFQAAGIDPGVVVDLAETPGRLLRFDGDGSVTAVVIESDAGDRRLVCDTVVVDFGRTPRDSLLRMGQGLNVRAVGSAAEPGDLPVCPPVGTVCPCNDVSVDDLAGAWERGFQEVELLKRASLAGTGTCQGMTCTPHVRAFVQELGGELKPAFTARPVARQLTLADAAAGQHHPAVPRTSLDAEHRRLGAQMDRIGGWWRPWSYGDVDAERAAVRTAVSLGDVGTLGKMLVSGSDAEAALQRLYPTDVSTIRPGRARYVLMLNERGYVLDDGMICRESTDDQRFYLTFTSGGASVAEMWARDWTADYDVRWMNLTMSMGAINVTGPLASELMRRAGFNRPLAFLRHTFAEVAGVDCRVLRLSFSGEQSFELHHPFNLSVELWQRLMELGADLDIAPHGLDARQRLRLEKGDFIGRHALTRTDRIELDKQLAGLTVEGPPPPEGAVLWHGDDYAGYVTSSAWSAELGCSVMLAWVHLRDGEVPVEVSVEGRRAVLTPTPFIDAEGSRARA